jgi:hypothetical protein
MAPAGEAAVTMRSRSISVAGMMAGPQFHNGTGSFLASHFPAALNRCLDILNARYAESGRPQPGRRAKDGQASGA